MLVSIGLGFHENKTPCNQVVTSSKTRGTKAGSRCSRMGASCTAGYRRAGDEALSGPRAASPALQAHKHFLLLRLHEAMSHFVMGG